MSLLAAPSYVKKDFYLEYSGKGLRICVILAASLAAGDINSL